MFADPEPPIGPESVPPESPPAGPSRIAELSAGARPAEVSDSARLKLLVEWEHATTMIARAEQMKQDAIKHQAKCAEAIVKKLGGAPVRFRDKLYQILESTKGVVFLREQVAKRKDG